MRHLLQVITILAFCAAALGAAALHDVDKLWQWESGGEVPHAFWPLALVVAGMIAMLVVGLMQRAEAKKAAGGGEAQAARKSEFVALLAAACEVVERLAKEAESLSCADIIVALDRFGAAELYDLTARHEELAGLLGYAGYARVWDGVATGERYLARAWSFATDDYLAESRELLPIAERRFARAREELARV